VLQSGINIGVMRY